MVAIANAQERGLSGARNSGVAVAARRGHRLPGRRRDRRARLARAPRRGLRRPRRDRRRRPRRAGLGRRPPPRLPARVRLGRGLHLHRHARAHERRSATRSAPTCPSAARSSRPSAASATASAASASARSAARRPSSASAPRRTSPARASSTSPRARVRHRVPDAARALELLPLALLRRGPLQGARHAASRAAGPAWPPSATYTLRTLPTRRRPRPAGRAPRRHRGPGPRRRHRGRSRDDHRRLPGGLAGHAHAPRLHRREGRTMTAWLNFDIHGIVGMRVAAEAPTAAQLRDMFAPFLTEGPLERIDLTVDADLEELRGRGPRRRRRPLHRRRPAPRATRACRSCTEGARLPRPRPQRAAHDRAAARRPGGCAQGRRR